MSKKKKILLAVCVLAVLLLNLAVILHKAPAGGTAVFEVNMQADVTETLQLFYGNDTVFSEKDSRAVNYQSIYANGTMGQTETLRLEIPIFAEHFRLDLGTQPGTFRFYELKIAYKQTACVIPFQKLQEAVGQQIRAAEVKTDAEGKEFLEITVEGPDPYLLFNQDITEVREAYQTRVGLIELIKKILILLFLDGGFLLMIRYRKKVFTLPVELYENRQLIFSLAKNDFKTKYAGSYLGIVWGFVQPVVTVLVYWFVFQVGLRSSSVGDTPFVLWMVSGLVPWFFFSDTLNAGTNSLIEYSYLVKKVVFKISILPLVKEISALFIHLFFVAFTLILFACYGYTPDLYTLQIVYYTFCLFVLALGICYATSAIVIFFRDLTQVINIILQIGVWATPIMWSIETINLPPQILWIFKINPLYYIVTGYRDSLINKVWFFEQFDMTAYFWIVTALLFCGGSVIFKRLKVHFADVL